jgi:hypothetical protein
MAAINIQADNMPENNLRFIVVKNLRDAENLLPRYENDYLMLVAPDGKANYYPI